MQGDKGVPGDKGPTGKQGVQGIPGHDGKKGAKGNKSYYQCMTNPHISSSIMIRGAVVVVIVL